MVGEADRVRGTRITPHPSLLRHDTFSRKGRRVFSAYLFLV
jgi:hypothetical protein